MKARVITVGQGNSTVYESNTPHLLTKLRLSAFLKPPSQLGIFP